MGKINWDAAWTVTKLAAFDLVFITSVSVSVALIGGVAAGLTGNILVGGLAAVAPFSTGIMTWLVLRAWLRGDK